MTQPDVFRTLSSFESRWNKLTPYFTAGTVGYGLFAGLVGSIPSLSVLMKVLAVWDWKLDLARLPQMLLDQYERIRNIAFSNIIEAIRQLAIPVPQWLAEIISTWFGDFLVLYFLLAVSIVRGSTINRRLDRMKQKTEPARFREDLRAAAFLHGNRSPDELVATVESGLGTDLRSRLIFQRRIWSSALRWPITLTRNFIQLKSGVAADLALGLVSIWMLMLACVLLGLIFYVLLSLFEN